MKYPLVSTSWLEDNLNNPNLILLDASMATVVGKVPLTYAELLCIPGARQLDLETEFCDLDSSQIHALPTVEQFTLSAQRLGVNADSLVVIYDNQGIYSAPRGWWMFKVMGFEHVYVLDGGLPQWLAEGRNTSPQFNTDIAQGNVIGHYISERICASADVLNNIDEANTDIIDARGKARFMGQAAEPRKGVRSGHIPHSLNLPFAEVLNAHKLKSPEELQAGFLTLLGDTATDTNHKLVFSCGSGITACIILLASAAIGYDNQVLYDGSWADWGSNPSLPIE